MRFEPTTFRPLFGRVLAVVVGVIVLLGLVGFVVSGEPQLLLRYAWGPLLVAAVAYWAFWLPSVRVDVPGVVIRNVFSTWHVPWPAIQYVDTKWALTLHLPGDRKVAAWASPAPNRYAAQVGRTRDSELAAKAEGGAIRPGDLLDTPSGSVAYVIRRHTEDLRETGLLDAGIEPGSLRRDWHWTAIVVLSLLAVATVLGVVV